MSVALQQVEGMSHLPGQPLVHQLQRVRAEAREVGGTRRQALGCQGFAQRLGREIVLAGIATCG